MPRRGAAPGGGRRDRVEDARRGFGACQLGQDGRQVSVRATAPVEVVANLAPAYTEARAEPHLSDPLGGE